MTSPFVTDSAQAASIAHLFEGVLILCALIVAIVAIGCTLALWRFRDRPGAAEPEQRFGNRRLETLWTALPLLAVIVTFGFTARVMAISDPLTAEERAPDVIVVGHQWWWEIRYPALGITTANELHLPVGRPIFARLLSADVIHDFWVPALGRKVDLIPGHPNQLLWDVERPGLLEGFCNEFCGAEHAWMQLRVEAQPAPEFDAWAQAQRRPANAPSGPEAEEGARLFRSLSCSGCHAVGGSGSPSIGPDLTHLASRATLGAGVLENGDESLTRWLKDPQRLKPGCHMPSFRFSQAQLSALTSFLRELK
ncbi:MAG: cytochrome c oxidase subunit II [Deltaproteobacteria bacterium]